MRHIMVMNPKGGCGKSTLATNIAAYFANEGATVALADFDPQGSSLHWLTLRPGDRPDIVGIAAFRDGLAAAQNYAEVVVMDAPARAHGEELETLLAPVEVVLVPVQPSEIDIQASRVFLQELYATQRFLSGALKVGLVGNRTRSNTLIHKELADYLSQQQLPYVGALRDAQNYVRAFRRGLSVFELPEYLAWMDWAQWEPITMWLETNSGEVIAAEEPDLSDMDWGRWYL